MQVTLEKVLMSDPCTCWRAPGVIEEVLSKIDCTSWLAATTDVMLLGTGELNLRDVWRTLVRYVPAGFPGATGLSILHKAVYKLTQTLATLEMQRNWPPAVLTGWLRLTAWTGDLDTLIEIRDSIPGHSHTPPYLAARRAYQLLRSFDAQAIALDLTSADLLLSEAERTTEKREELTYWLAQLIDEEEAKQGLHTSG